MNERLYEFNTGVTASAQPDAGTPTDPNDLVTLGFVTGGGVGTEIQEVPSGAIDGSNTAYTLSHTPKSAASVKLYSDGLFLRQGTDYTISGVNITISLVLQVGQTLDAVYIY